MIDATHELSPDTFQRDGYVIVRGLAGREDIEAMREAVLHALDPLQAPAEFETDVGYPGSPASRDAEGGNTRGGCCRRIRAARSSAGGPPRRSWRRRFAA